jgi:hypothetical protein
MAMDFSSLLAGGFAVAQPMVTGASGTGAGGAGASAGGSGSGGNTDNRDQSLGKTGAATGNSGKYGGSGYSGEIQDRRDNQNKSGNVSLATLSTSTGPSGAGTRGFVINVGSGSQSVKDTGGGSAGGANKWLWIGLAAVAAVLAFIYLRRH